MNTSGSDLSRETFDIIALLEPLALTSVGKQGRIGQCACVCVCVCLPLHGRSRFEHLSRVVFLSADYAWNAGRPVQSFYADFYEVFFAAKASHGSVHCVLCARLDCMVAGDRNRALSTVSLWR